MFWKKKEAKTDDNKKNDNQQENNSTALVRQDPRTKVKTASAATESTNTSVQNATILNSNDNTVTYRSTRQTVTHTQQARITEMVTRRTPTVDELKELFAQINVGSSGGVDGENDGEKAKRNSTRPPHLNAVALRSTANFKHTNHSPLSPLAFKFEMPTDGSKRSSTIIKTEQTTVTQKNGRSVTQHVEEQRIKLKSGTKYGGGGSGAFKATSKMKTKTTTPTASTTTNAAGGFRYSDARLAAIANTPLTAWQITTATTSGRLQPTAATATTTLSTYSSPYANRPITAGSSSLFSTTQPLSITSSSPYTARAVPTSNGSAATASSSYAYKPPASLAALRPNNSSAATSGSSYAYKPPASLAALKTTAATAPTTAKSPYTSTSIKGSTKLDDVQPQLSSTIFNPLPLSSTSSLSSVSSSSTKKQSKLKPGYVYIFNHEKFNDPKNEFRVGSSVDVNALCETFKNFKCKVKIIKNATLDMVNKTVANIECKDYSENSCLVIVILSHGTRHDYIAAKDGDYSIDDNFLFPILRNRTLNDKPKLFFVQACKGAMEVGKFHKDATQPHGAPNEIFKCYSTFEGYASYRTQEGSIFIQAFCERLKRFGHAKDIREIMSDVALAVKQQSQDKQIPTSTSNMTRSYVFGDYV